MAQREGCSGIGGISCTPAPTSVRRVANSGYQRPRLAFLHRHTSSCISRGPESTGVRSSCYWVLSFHCSLCNLTFFAHGLSLFIECLIFGLQYRLRDAIQWYGRLLYCLLNDRSFPSYISSFLGELLVQSFTIRSTNNVSCGLSHHTSRPTKPLEANITLLPVVNLNTPQSF